MSTLSENPFIRGPLGRIFAKTALPIIFVMSMNGLLTVVDAIFLGRYVGADALAAVTLMFPLYMLTVALATLVSGGMSSQLARALGANDIFRAQSIYAGAHGLAILLGALLIAGFVLFGWRTVLFLAADVAPLAQMGHVYLGITVFLSPLAFILSINSDALRNEGRVGLMAAMSLLVSLSNIGFNYLLIVELGRGVAGSAYGTGLAQLLGFAIILSFRIWGHTALRPTALWTHPLTGHWRRMLALGAPQSLNFIGLALGSAAIILALQRVSIPAYDTTVSAYGIFTRVMTFFFLPLLGLTFALQSIVGNNFGAKAWARSDAALRMGLMLGLAYGTAGQILLTSYTTPIGALFVDDPAVIAELARIVPMATAMMWLARPLVVLGSYFQAIGDATRAALLGLSKPYLFALPLTLTLPLFLGETGIWIAGPLAEIMLGMLAIAVLTQISRHQKLRLGLFHAPG